MRTETQIPSPLVGEGEGEGAYGYEMLVQERGVFLAQVMDSSRQTHLLSKLLGLFVKTQGEVVGDV